LWSNWEKIMGEWIYRDEYNHKCPKPSWVPRTKVGDIWQCDCGKTWEVKKIDGDFRENWIVWEENPGTGIRTNRPGFWGDGSGIYAPGTK